MSAPEQGGLSSDELADWLGEMHESRNVFDYTDEATTVISIDVETLAERIAARLAAVPAAEAELRAAVDGLADLNAAATPGPWRQEFYRDGELLPDGSGGLDDYETPGSGVYVIDQTSDDGYCLTEFDAGRAPDAAFIVAAVNLVRSLLAGRGDV